MAAQEKTEQRPGIDDLLHGEFHILNLYVQDLARMARMRSLPDARAYQRGIDESVARIIGLLVLTQEEE